MGEPKTKKRVRTGVVVEGAEGEPARFKAGRAASGSGVAPATVAAEMKIWWVNGDGNQFVIGDEKSGWSVWNEGKLYTRMRSIYGPMISSKARDDERISSFDQVLMHVMTERRVEKMLPAVGGYPSGMHEDKRGRRIIVATGPRYVEAKKGEWGMIREIIEARMNLKRHAPGGIDQTPWFYAWLKYADESLHAGPGKFATGHCLVMAGQRGCGKGFIQEYIVTPILGGRSADPKPFLVSKKPDDFNAELVEAEHWMQEEIPLENQKMETRVMLSERVKDAVTKQWMRMRLMRTEPLMVDPFHRLSISLNNDADKLRNLPLITEDFADKIILLKLEHQPMPMPTGTLQEKAAFREAVEAELPAFVWWLRHEFEMPQELLVYPEDHVISPNGPATRFGFREFQHPELVMQLFEDTPAAELMMLIDAATFSGSSFGGEKKLWELPSKAKKEGKAWHGNALTLETLLRGDDPDFTSSVAKNAGKLFAHNKIDRLLGRLADDEKSKGDQARIVAKRFAGGLRGWLVLRPSIR